MGRDFARFRCTGWNWGRANLATRWPKQDDLKPSQKAL